MRNINKVGTSYLVPIISTPLSSDPNMNITLLHHLSSTLFVQLRYLTVSSCNEMSEQQYTTLVIERQMLDLLIAVA